MPPLLTTSGPLTVVDEVILVCVMPVTFGPMPPVAPIVTTPLLVLELSTRPLLLIAEVENVRAPLPVLLIVRLLEPVLVMPPLKVGVRAPATAPTVRVPVSALSRIIALA